VWFDFDVDGDDNIVMEVDLCVLFVFEDNFYGFVVVIDFILVVLEVELVCDFNWVMQWFWKVVNFNCINVVGINLVYKLVFLVLIFVLMELDVL